MDRSRDNTKLHADNTRSSVSIHRNDARTRVVKSHSNKSHNKRNFGHRYNKYLQSVAISIAMTGFMPSAIAETVGGVSATASPIANSSGSVTNQAIQVLQGPYITNTYGGGIQCQGATLNVTPYATGSATSQKPFEEYWDSPVYDMSDLDDNGVLDNPGNILYYVPTRTAQKDNYNFSVGVSATWSKPLDKKLQEQCKQAADANIALMNQTVANKRLDFEIARLKNCGELLKAGISFHPKSPYYAICADVMVNGKNVITPHVHDVQPTSFSTSSESLKEVTLSIGDID